MKWRRAARAVIAVLAVALVVVVALAVKRRAPASDASGARRTDPGAVVESTGGRVQRFKLSREDVRVDYDKNLTYADGSTKLVGITITTDNRAGGRSFIIKAKEADLGQNESTIALTGNVRLTSSDGTVIATEHATYSDKDGIIQAAGPVNFSGNRMTGSGIGMTYDNGRDVLSILSHATVHVAPDEKGAGSLDVTSDRATVARRDKFVRFEEHVVLRRAGQNIESDEVVAVLSDDEKRIQTMDLRGNARVSSAKVVAGGLQTLTGRNMNLKYAEDGQTLEHALIDGDAVIALAGERGKAGRQIDGSSIDIVLGPDGTTPVGLAARENVRLLLPAEPSVPARTIHAATMNGTGEPGRGLTHAQFVGNVQYQERGQNVDRGATSATLDVVMKPGMSEIEEARFAHAVHFTEGKMTATAAVGRYDLGKGLLELTGTEPGAVTPHVVNDRIAVDATRIDVTLAGPKLKATGTVKSVMRPAAGNGVNGGNGASGAKADAHLPGMLKQDQPVNITGDTLDYDGGASKAVYTGSAQLWQGETTVKGSAITLDDKTGDLAAAGPVTTVTSLDESDKDKKKTRARSTATAKDFKYEDALHRATYTGDAHMSGPDGDLTAAKIELYLKPSGDELDRVEGYDAVALTDEKHRKTTGTRLTYVTADERYVVLGLPVTIVDECGRETKGRTLTYVKTADTIVVDGNEQTRTQTKGNSKCSGS